MKSFVALLGGFFFTLIIFGGGALTAVFFVNAEPAAAPRLDGNGAIWTTKAVRVNAAAQDYERLPSQPANENAPREIEVQPASESPSMQPVPVDQLKTAAVSVDQAPEINAAHVEWCSQQFRSYNPASNSYNAYSGAIRECISPYSETDPSYEEAQIPHVEYAAELVNSAYPNEVIKEELSSRHIQSCFERYQSYRPQDNSYQPYGGGPRRQCE